jgi:hypothetical protein
LKAFGVHLIHASGDTLYHYVIDTSKHSVRYMNTQHSFLQKAYNNHIDIGRLGMLRLFSSVGNISLWGQRSQLIKHPRNPIFLFQAQSLSTMVKRKADSKVTEAVKKVKTDDYCSIQPKQDVQGRPIWPAQHEQMDAAREFLKNW